MMVEYGEHVLGDRWAPALQCARRESARRHALAALRHVRDGRPRAGGRRARSRAPLGWTYALTLGFALVYLGEHYVIDLLAGLALAEGVRAAAPRVAPAAAAACRRAVQALEAQGAA